MAKQYTKTTWVDETLTGDERYDILTDGGAPIEEDVQIDLATAVAQAGTPVDADNMNNVEEFLDGLDDLLNDSGAENQALTIVNGAPAFANKTRVVTVTNAAQPTWNSEAGDEFEILDVGQNITSMTANRSGTPAKGDWIGVYLQGDAAYTLAWGADFDDGPVALPEALTANVKLSVLFRFDGSVYRCYAADEDV
jgi:hypothetical protein